MAQPVLLQEEFQRMYRDRPRNRMPQGSLWNAVDYIADNEAALRGRGGWGNAASVSAVSSSATQIRAGLYAPFYAGAQNIAIDEDGLMWKFTSGGTVTLVGTALLPLQNPVFHADTLIVPSPQGTTAPVKYNGSAISAMDASVPAGRYACVFKDYTVLASSAANPRRMWFSTEGSPGGVWDTTYSIIDFSREIIGVAALKNAILAFHADVVSRLRGSSPPASSDTGDFVKDDPAFSVGLLDARSISVWGEQAYWCSPDGVFRTDGVALDDITLRGGMLGYWQELMTAYASTYTIAGGHFNNTYLICIMNGATFVDAFMIDCGTYAWSRISNIDAVTMWGSIATVDEIYWGRRGAGVVAKGSSMWTPASAVKNDGNGTAVTPVAETPFYEGPQGPKRIKSVYVGSQLTDYATDNPTMTISYITTVEATSYTNLGVTVAESSTYQRTKHQIGGHMEGIAFKFTRTNAGDTKLYSIEAEIEAEETGRLVT